MRRDDEAAMQIDLRARGSDSAKYRHSGVCSQISSANTGTPSRFDGIRAQVSRISFDSG